MYTVLIYFHSYFRYAVLLLLIIAVFKSLKGWLGKEDYKRSDNLLGLLTGITNHLQLLIGLALYFISPFVRFSGMGSVMKNPEIRFWTVEHILGMLIAVILITLGMVYVKKAPTGLLKHKKTAIFFGIGLLIILISIPWPFSSISREMFIF